MERLTNLQVHHPIADGFVDTNAIDEIQKAHVQAHARKTKTGKMSQVKTYDDKRQKKKEEFSNQASKKRTDQKTSKDRRQGNNPSAMRRRSNDSQNNQDEQQEPMPQHHTGEVEKEEKHLQFMLDKYPDLIDKKKVVERMKSLKDGKRKVQDALDDLKTSKYYQEDDNEDDDKMQKDENVKVKKLADVLEKRLGKDYKVEYEEGGPSGSSIIVSCDNGFEANVGMSISPDPEGEYSVSIEEIDDGNEKEFANAGAIAKYLDKQNKLFDKYPPDKSEKDKYASKDDYEKEIPIAVAKDKKGEKDKPRKMKENKAGYPIEKKKDKSKNKKKVSSAFSEELEKRKKGKEGDKRAERNRKHEANIKRERKNEKRRKDYEPNLSDMGRFANEMTKDNKESEDGAIVRARKLMDKATLKHKTAVDSYHKGVGSKQQVQVARDEIVSASNKLKDMIEKYGKKKDKK
jgi:hypothetical protein